MEEEKSSVSLFAVCVNNSEYPASLELHKIYRVLPDEEATVDGDMRVIDESGEDYLYPAEWFVLVELPEVVEQSLLQVV
jgi:hypothetical protein